MTEVVEINEGELVQKDPNILVVPVRRPIGRPPPVANRVSSTGRASALKPVTEKEDEEIEDLSASYRSFDGIDTEVIRRLSTMDDSGRSERTGLSTLTEGAASQSTSSSSGTNRSSGTTRSSRNSRIRKMTEQVQQFSMGGLEDGNRLSMSYDPLGSSFSLPSGAFSKSSVSTLGMSLELGEHDGLSPKPAAGPRNNRLSAGVSTSSMPRLSDFSVGQSFGSMPSLSDFSVMDRSNRSGHSSIMPGLGDILEEEVSYSSASFSSFHTGGSSFNTGASFNTRSSNDNDSLGIVIGGRPMSEILKEQEQMAGKTLDVLAPTIPEKKPTTQRWTSEETTPSSNSSSRSAPRSHHPNHDAPKYAPRRISDTSVQGFGTLAEFSPRADMPPQLVQRQSTASTMDSQQIPDMSPLEISGRDRVSIYDGRRNTIPSLSPPRSTGDRFSSEPKRKVAATVPPPRFDDEDDSDSEIDEDSSSEEEEEEEEEEDKPPLRPISPKIWSRYGTKRFTQSSKDAPSMPSRRISG